MKKYVVLNTATAIGKAGNSFYGLAIGFTMTAMVFFFGGISGRAFNPEIAVGISTANMADWPDIWIYLPGTLLGGAAAAYVNKFVDQSSGE